MNVLAYLIPISLFLGSVGLIAFVYTVRSPIVSGTVPAA